MAQYVAYIAHAIVLREAGAGHGVVLAGVAALHAGDAVLYGDPGAGGALVVSVGQAGHGEVGDDADAVVSLAADGHFHGGES